MAAIYTYICCTQEHERRESKREEKEDLAHVLIYYIVDLLCSRGCPSALGRRHTPMCSLCAAMHFSLDVLPIVPPAETDGFVDVWRETAERTLKEERGNRVFSLASLKDDNTRFYGYGTWDSMDDYLDHFQSSHVRKLREYLEDRDIIYFVAPLRKIGNQPEDRYSSGRTYRRRPEPCEPEKKKSYIGRVKRIKRQAMSDRVWLWHIGETLAT
eukprot:scaffold159555_cov18-Tisochrysis_lutea.AAC.1